MFKGICEVCGAKTKPSNKRYCSEECMFNLVKINENGCKEWQGALTAYGYGQVNHKGKIRMMHILSYEKFRGPRKGLCVLHTCDNRKCINPLHLFLGTKQQNTWDMIAKGRKNPAKGEASSKSKLTAEQVYEIRDLYASGVSMKKLGKKYGVANQSIDYIVKRRNWKHLPERAGGSV